MGERIQQSTHLSCVSNSELGSGPLGFTRKVNESSEETRARFQVCAAILTQGRNTELLPPPAHVCSPDRIPDPYPCLPPWLPLQGVSGLIKGVYLWLFPSCLSLANAQGQETLRAGVNSHNKAMDAPMLGDVAKHLHQLTQEDSAQTLLL